MRLCTNCMIQRRQSAASNQGQTWPAGLLLYNTEMLKRPGTQLPYDIKYINVNIITQHDNVAIQTLMLDIYVNCIKV